MAVPVQAAVVKEGLLTVDRSTAGVVTPVVQSQVAAQVAGVVKQVYRTAGDWVKAGQIVVQLDDAQLKLSLANAQASLENAKINLKIGQDNATQANPKLALQVQSAQSALDSAQKFYDSQKALYDLGGISASALDTAASQLSAAKANLEGAKSALDQNNKSDDQTIAQLKLGVQQAQNQVAQAELNLQNASIRAPFEGQIASINMQAGMYVALNTPVFSLVSRESQVNFSISPSDSPYLNRGSTVLFIVSGQGIPVKVSQAPSAPLNGVVPLTASLPPSVSLPFGAVGTISYTVPVAKGIIVPLMALQTLENRTYVFKILEGKVAINYVTITGEAGTNAVVSGLSNGDTVAVSPPPGLIQGSPVQAILLGSDQSGSNKGGGAPTAGKK
jgi:multidrug efflux pump subunit AcrA (membrane-fusion protein)